LASGRFLEAQLEGLNVEVTFTVNHQVFERRYFSLYDFFLRWLIEVFKFFFQINFFGKRFLMRASGCWRTGVEIKGRYVLI